MITTPTTFVLGAGISASYHYPTAKELKANIIASLTDESGADFSELFECGFKKNQIVEFATDFHFSAQYSVDAFVERRAEYIPIGKAAIAQQLLKKEMPSAELFADKSPYAYLLNRMDSSFEDFSKNKVSFVTFNYDLSLEFFLTFALTTRFGKSAKEVAETIKEMSIVHVYGDLGRQDLEALSMTKTPKKIQGAEAILRAASNIKIFSEKDAENTPELERARKCIAEAKRIFFLGFGYHPENMRRLKLPFGEIGRTFCGSGKGLTNAEIGNLTGKYLGLTILEHHDAINYLRNEPRFTTD